MIKAFIDASVLFAAAYSSQGYARDLFLLATQEKLLILLSEDILEEATRNLEKKAPEKSHILNQLLHLANAKITEKPTIEEVKLAEAYVEQKDAHVVAAAIAINPGFLVTFDQKHLLKPPEVARISGLMIVTPEVVVDAVMNEQKNGE